jgi:hypothetical protein
MSPNH